MSFPSRTITWLLMITIVGACSKGTPVTEVMGPCGDVYNAPVCTWAKMRGDSDLLPVLVPSGGRVRG